MQSVWGEGETDRQTQRERQTDKLVFNSGGLDSEACGVHFIIFLGIFPSFLRVLKSDDQLRGKKNGTLKSRESKQR